MRFWLKVSCVHLPQYILEHVVWGSKRMFHQRVDIDRKPALNLRIERMKHGSFDVVPTKTV